MLKVIRIADIQDKLNIFHCQTLVMYMYNEMKKFRKNWTTWSVTSLRDSLLNLSWKFCARMYIPSDARSRVSKFFEDSPGKRRTRERESGKTRRHGHGKFCLRRFQSLERAGTRTRPLTLPALHKWPRSPWLRSCNFYWTIVWSNNDHRTP